MRRRRTVRLARESWFDGPIGALYRMAHSQPGMAAAFPNIAKIVDLLELAPGRRYLDIGCATAPLAGLIAAKAGLEDAPVCVDLAGEPGPVDALVWPEKLPFADNSFDCITSFHYIRRLDDDMLHAFAEELSRILAPGGAGLVVEFAPVRSARLNRLHTRIVSGGCAEVDLRGWGRTAALMTECEFGAIDLVNLGPALLPPIPRVAVLIRHFPEGFVSGD